MIGWVAIRSHADQCGARHGNAVDIGDAVAILGLVRPDAGTIHVCGFDVATDLQAARSAMGVVLDPLQLFERLTAREFLHTLGELRGLDGELTAERAAVRIVSAMSPLR